MLLVEDDLQSLDAISIGLGGEGYDVATATDRGGETIVIDAEMVRERVEELAKNADLSKFIL